MATPKPYSLSLWIDTATPYLFVALCEEDHVLKEVYAKGENDHSKTLMPTIDEVLRQAGASVKALKDITVGVGPGSYTGTRIGVVVAKTLAQGLDIPLYQVSSLALMASHYDTPVIAAVDARRGYVFAGQYDTVPTINVRHEDVYTTLETFQTSPALKVVYEGKPVIEKCFNVRTLVDDLYALAPTYLRQTQAENEHEHQTA